MLPKDNCSVDRKAHERLQRRLRGNCRIGALLRGVNPTASGGGRERVVAVRRRWQTTYPLEKVGLWRVGRARLVVLGQVAASLRGAARAISNRLLTRQLAPSDATRE